MKKYSYLPSFEPSPPSSHPKCSRSAHGVKSLESVSEQRAPGT
jgi:hypothetical protein